MTIGKLYRDFLTSLQTIYNGNESTIMTDWAFESIANIKRPDVVVNPGGILTDDFTEQLQSALKRLLAHEPIQYVTGEAWFYKMKLKVNEHVLIPRPETEALVQLVIDYVNDSGKNTPTILDIGTGSGCIPIALKKNLRNATVAALDVSAGALLVAKENAKKQDTEVQFSGVDFLNENDWKELQTFDVIVSNPPYIPANEKNGMDKTVTDFEPSTALFVPDDQPLLFYEKIASFAATHLQPDGIIFVETHENLAHETADIFRQLFVDVTVHKDLFGKERMVSASRFR